MPDHNSRNAPVPHEGPRHIGQLIRQKYPETQAVHRPARIRNFISQTTATILACIIVLVATPAAVHLLANRKLLYGLAALVTALGAAFGPKIYADFIQPKHHNSPGNLAD